jgi:hypothetical protein
MNAGAPEEEGGAAPPIGIIPPIGDIPSRAVSELAAEAQAAADGSRSSDPDAALRAAVQAQARDVCLEVAEHGRAGGVIIVGGEAFARILRSPPGPPPRDADFLCSGDSKPVAVAMARRIREMGVETACKPAKHCGTWRIFAAGAVVADVTGVRPDEFRGLRAAARPCPTVAPVEYLKMSAHFELSRPTVFPGRWPVVFRRLAALYREFPPADPPSRRSVPVRPLAAPGASIVRAASLAAEGARGSVLIAGGFGAELAGMLGAGSRSGCDRVDVVVVSRDEDDSLMTAIKLSRCHPGLLTDGPFPPSLLLPGFSSVLDADGRELARVYHSTVPLTAAGDGLASVDVVMFLLYGEVLLRSRTPAWAAPLAATVALGLVGADGDDPRESRESPGGETVSTRGAWRRLLLAPER